MLALAEEKRWTAWQLDVQTAFLYTDVEERVGVKMAPGCEAKDQATGAPLAMKLPKSIYSLKARHKELAWNHGHLPRGNRVQGP